MSDIWLGPRPRNRGYGIELPKELYRTRAPRAPGGMKEAPMFRFENDLTRLLAIGVLTFGAVCITAMWVVFR